MADHSSAVHRIGQLLELARRGERTLVMGIVNVTPDSFSDGGRYLDPDAAVRHAERMAADGADIIDVGGESTRPGAPPVPVQQELDRVLPVVEALAARVPVSISVDTYKAEVARQALRAGAAMVNDVSALTADAGMAAVVCEAGAAVCLMHMKGTPASMAQLATYADVVGEVRTWLAERAEAAQAAGIAPDRIVVDPGFGFAKTAAHNLELLRRLGEIRSLGYPVLAGLSRKSTIGRILGGLPPEERLEGTAAAVALSVAYGAAIVRVHDVKEMARVVRVADAVVRGTWRDEEWEQAQRQ